MQLILVPNLRLFNSVPVLLPKSRNSCARTSLDIQVCGYPSVDMNTNNVLSSTYIQAQISKCGYKLQTRMIVLSSVHIQIWI